MDTKRFLNILGAKIRSARKARKISQEKLAELSGLHPTYVSDIENGKVNASVYSYYVLSQALCIPLSELIEMPTKSIDKEIESGVAELLSSIRTLDKKKQIIFLSASRGLLAGIEKTK